MLVDFEIFDPAEATYSAVSSPINIAMAELDTGFSYVPDKDTPVMINDLFVAHVDIRDLSSQMRVEDITWAVCIILTIDMQTIFCVGFAILKIAAT